VSSAKDSSRTQVFRGKTWVKLALTSEKIKYWYSPFVGTKKVFIGSHCLLPFRFIIFYKFTQKF